MQASNHIHQAASLLAQGELLELEHFLTSITPKTKQLIILENIINIFKEEVKNNEPFSIFDYSLNLDELINHYIITKLLLRRLDFDLPSDCQEEFYFHCINTHVSGSFITYLLKHNTFHPEKVHIKIISLFEKGGINLYE